MKSIPQYFSLSNAKHNHSSNKWLIWYKHVEFHDNELSDLKGMLDNQSITEKQYIDEMYCLWEKYYGARI